MAKEKTYKKAVRSLTKRKQTDIYLLPLNATDAEIEEVVDELLASQEKNRQKQKEQAK